MLKKNILHKTLKQIGKVFLCCIFMALFMFFPAGTVLAKTENLTIEQALMNTFSYLGKEVKWTGVVKEVLSPGIPLKILIVTDDVKWIVHYYDTKAMPPVAKGKSITVTGILYGLEKVFLHGTKGEVMTVMGQVE